MQSIIRSTRRRSRGFSLIELGIVIGVIAVLFTSVMVLRGFKQSARISAGIQLVDTLEKAARSWSERHTNRTGFVAALPVGGISIANLEADGLIGPNTVTPWNTVVRITPSLDPEFFVISFDTEDSTSALDLYTSMRKKRGVQVPVGRTIRVISR